MTITDVLEELGLDYRRPHEHHHVRGTFVGIDCPLCSPGSQSFKLGLNPPAATCWSCGRQALAWVLHLASNRPYGQVKDLLGGLARGEPAPNVRPRGRLVLPGGLRELSELPAHRRYLRSRGVDPEYAAQVWGVKGIGLAPRLCWRLWLPVELNGKTLSWTTRSIGEDPMRYVSAAPDEEAVPRNELLYGESLAGHAVLVVEGPLDAVRVGPGAVATMGLKVSPAQVSRLARFPLRFVCLDNEPGAQRAARRLCEELGGHPGRTSLVELDAKDPGEASERELRQLRRLLK